jgi:predicted MPP superfamily phosphohydrolase
MSITGNSGPFKIHEIEIASSAAKGLRILHISDLHFAPGQTSKANFMAKLAELEPDLVINTGDNLGHKDAINPALLALEPLRQFPGVFVNGSNDYRAPKPRNPMRYFMGPSKNSTPGVLLDTERFEDELIGSGWLNLNNKAGQLEINSTRIGFLGLNDAHEGLEDFAGLPKQTASLKEVDITIGVAHAPYLEVIDAFLEQRVEIMFAGHTHGGQLCLPGQKALITNCDLPTKYASGLSAWSDDNHQAMLHVSNGIGCSIYAPLRIFCPPSATLITLS